MLTLNPPKHSFQRLQPANNWDLAIDETGSTFRRGGDGKFVALLRPVSYRPIKGLPFAFHTAELPRIPDPDFHRGDLTGLDKGALRAKLFQLLLADDSLGFFGIDSEQMPNTPGDGWLGGVLQVISWALLLIPLAPINGKNTPPCTVNIWVEEHAQFKAGATWEGAVELLKQRLADAMPERAHFKLVLRVSHKSAHPLLAGTDLLAYTWQKTDDAQRAGLTGTVLFGGPAHDLSQALELVYRKELDGDGWRWLLKQPGVRKASSPVGAGLLRVAAHLTRQRWSRLLAAALAHLDSASVNFTDAGREIRWLNEHRPASTDLPATAKLALYISELGLNNHKGETLLSPSITSLRAHCDPLFDEAPALVCLAELHYAVFETNRFNFEAARQSLARWEHLPIAAGGLRMRGRVLSSLGQHAAFLGEHNAAIAHFKQALNLFSRLSNPADRARESDQTQTYLAIATLDSAADLVDVTREVEAVIGPLNQAVQSLPASSDPASIWSHYLLVRLLAHRMPRSSLAQTYLRRSLAGSIGRDFPWPLIALYQAVLSHHSGNTHRRNLLLKTAQNLTLNEGKGPVLWLIGAVAATVAHQFGQTWPELSEQLDAIEEELPLAASQIEHLRLALNQPHDPLYIIKGALPFNFC